MFCIKRDQVATFFSLSFFFPFNCSTSTTSSDSNSTVDVGGGDENQQALKDPLHVLVVPITRARSKKIKEALNRLIQEIWADSNIGDSKLGPKEDKGVINLIHAIEG